jgi:hypothetical protein
VTILLARLKQAAKYILAGLVFVGLAIAAVMRFRRREVMEERTDLALDRWERTTEEASARAAVEIAVARARSDAERAALMDVLREADQGDQQLDKLIEVGRRIREGR